MNRPLGAYLEDYSLLGQPEAVADMDEIVRAYPWFTLGRYMQLRALATTDTQRYNDAWRAAAIRLYSHPYPRVMLTQEIHYGAPFALPAAGPEPAEPDTLSVIDGFLSREPGRITPLPSELTPEEPEDISAESVAENTEIASETLAAIYAAQGHNHKAIEIYSQLILKYPEKSTYFANLIAGLAKQQSS